MALSPDLIDRARRGDEQAWTCIVEEVTPRLLARIHSVIQDLEESRDVLQMTFVDAYSKLDRFRGGTLEAWLYRTATRRALHHRRGFFRRRGRIPTKDRIEVSRAQREEIARPPSCTVQVLCDADRSLWAACESLPRRQREVFIGRAIDELSFREIARRIGALESTARCRFTKARKNLQRMLEDDPAIQALRIWEEP